MQNVSITNVISTITFRHAEKDLCIKYQGPIHGANAIINTLYPGHTNKDGSTAFSEYDLTKGDYQIIEVSTGIIIDDVSIVA